MASRKSLRRILRWIAGAAAVGFAYLSYVYLTLPDVRTLRATNPATTAFIELRLREALAAGQKPRRVQHWVPYRSMSRSLTRAVLVAEDDAFWEHEGLDVAQLERSFEVNLAAGRFVRGASTITQQLAKNLYLSPSRNPLRKFKELIIARRLEAELDKARILELYLNVIEWGHGIYGAEAAARTYFRRSAASLGPSESALLAGAIVNPRLLNPARPTARLRQRQALILKRMGSVTPPPAPEFVAPPPLVEPSWPEPTVVQPAEPPADSRGAEPADDVAPPTAEPLLQNESVEEPSESHAPVNDVQ